MLLKEFDDKEYDILNKIESEKDLDTVNKTVSFIEKNCTDILELYRNYGKYFYRGINISIGFHSISKNSNIYFGKAPENRRPIDTPFWMQKQLDIQLNGAGFKALRSNSIFCIGNKTAAFGYGEAYMIFPVNGFDYSWCNSAVDLFKEFIQANFKCPWEDSPSRTEKEEADKFKEDIYRMSPQEFIEYYGFKDNDLSHALVKEHEVLIHGDYVAISGKFGEEIVKGDKK